MVKTKRKKESILKAENFITPGHKPEKLMHREDEIEEIKNSIRPMFKGRKPENLFIFGPPGTGKTLCVERVQEELEDNTTATTVYVNAWNYDTRTSCYSKILHKLGIPSPRKGKPVDVLYDRIIEAADKKRNLVIAIDEVDQLGPEKSKTIYDLVRIDQDGKNFKVAVIIIGYKPDILSNLDRRAKSSFSPKNIRFTPYTKGEIKDILKNRVEKAFHPGSVEEETIEKIAEFAASESGDCRMALEILMKAGRQADFDNANKIEDSHLENVLD